MTGDELTLDELAENRHYEDFEEEKEVNYDYGSTITYGNSAKSLGPTWSVTTVATSSAASSVASQSSQPSQPMIFDLSAMGIVQIGSFDSSGMATGWIVTNTILGNEYPAFMQIASPLSLHPSPDHHVFIRGVFSKYLTNERRAAMGLPAI